MPKRTQRYDLNSAAIDRSVMFGRGRESASMQSIQQSILDQRYSGGGVNAQRFIDATKMNWSTGPQMPDVGIPGSGRSASASAAGSAMSSPREYLAYGQYKRDMQSYYGQASKVKAQNAIFGSIGAELPTPDKPVFSSGKIAASPKTAFSSGPMQLTGAGTMSLGYQRTGGPGGIGASPGAKAVREGAKAKAAVMKGQSMASVAYGGANRASKAVLGASIGKLALGAGLTVGALALVDSAIGRDPFADAGRMAGGVQRFGSAMQQAQRPSYGQSAFQQSTQGLTFGLHNARTSF